MSDKVDIPSWFFVGAEPYGREHVRLHYRLHPGGLFVVTIPMALDTHEERTAIGNHLAAGRAGYRYETGD